MIKAIKIYGERQCGNNYLMHLCKLNTEFDPLELHLKSDRKLNFPFKKHLGWTHGILYAKDNTTLNNTLFIITVKNPYSWLVSLHSNPHQGKTQSKIIKAMPFEEFIRAEIDGFKNPIEMWNAKYIKWAQFIGIIPHGIVCQYESMLAHPQGFFTNLNKLYRIELKDFQNVENITQSNGTISDEKFAKREYYQYSLWAKKITDFEFINNNINQQLMRSYGYSIYPGS